MNNSIVRTRLVLLFLQASKSQSSLISLNGKFILWMMTDANTRWISFVFNLSYNQDQTYKEFSFELVYKHRWHTGAFVTSGIQKCLKMTLNWGLQSQNLEDLKYQLLRTYPAWVRSSVASLWSHRWPIRLSLALSLSLLPLECDGDTNLDEILTQSSGLSSVCCL